MELHKLAKINTKKSKRVGRGEGSGKGKTAGKGEKGQKKRGSVKPGFEGGQLPIYQRLPQKRGVGNLRQTTKIAIKTDELNKVATGKKIDAANLVEAGVISASDTSSNLKIVAGGKIEKKINVDLPVTKKAKTIIEKAGGKVLDEDAA